MDKQEQKERLRKELLSKRKGILHKQWVRHSDEIIRRLKTLPSFQRADTLHCYVSMNKRREVNTHPLLKQLLATEKQVIVPVTHPGQGTLTHHRLTSFEDLRLNKWGVPEPEDGEKVPVSILDLVLVPMVGGDEHCNRIGYGGGFYDRFLKKVTCPKVGLLFEQNIVPKLPSEPFDVSLDKIITESRIIAL